MPKIKDVAIIMVLLSYFSRYLPTDVCTGSHATLIDFSSAGAPQLKYTSLVSRQTELLLTTELYGIAVLYFNLSCRQNVNYCNTILAPSTGQFPK